MFLFQFWGVQFCGFTDPVSGVTHDGFRVWWPGSVVRFKVLLVHFRASLETFLGFLGLLLVLVLCLRFPPFGFRGHSQSF